MIYSNVILQSAVTCLYLYLYLLPTLLERQRQGRLSHPPRFSIHMYGVLYFTGKQVPFNISKVYCYDARS
jgi:hypothetical protein